MVDITTKKLQKITGTEISINSVDFSLFNKFFINDVLVRDKKKDTLLHAASVKVRITDWFFLKDNITLQYVGIEKGLVKIHRIDSNWNYQFLIDAFSSSQPSKSSNSRLQLNIKELEINQLHFSKIDGWRGEDMHLKLGSLKLSAKEIDLKKNLIKIDNIDIKKPYFEIVQYEGKRPTKFIPISVPNEKWNPDNWNLKTNKITIENGEFISNVKTIRKAYNYFDGQHIQFLNINGELKNIILTRDTITANVKLKTEERSGFVLNSLVADFTMHPKQMAFTNLQIKTPYSTIGNSFSMSYDSFNDDMPYFISKIMLRGTLKNAKVGFKDIAFFAPEVKPINDLEFNVTGNIKGPIQKLEASNLIVKYGSYTSLSGDFNMEGLPNPTKFNYTLSNTKLITHPFDVFTFSPYLKTIKGIDFASLGNTILVGNVSGNSNDLNINGSISTLLGNITTDLKLKDIASKSIKMSLNGSLFAFNTGKLIGLNTLKSTTGNYNLSLAENNKLSYSLDLKSTIFNGYDYSNINVNGNFEKGFLNNMISVKDKNFVAGAKFLINLNDKLPLTEFESSITSSNLQALNITKLPLKFAGKTNGKISGDNLENLIGEMQLEDLILYRNEQAYIMDNMTIKANVNGNYKNLDIKGSDIDASMQGNFDYGLISNTFNDYFSNYYPLYFTRENKKEKNQDISFDIKLKNTNSFLKILGLGISGFDNSSITGGINTSNKLFTLNANIPRFSYNKLDVYDYSINARGSSDSLIVKSKSSALTFNDSLSFPSNDITLRTARNVSALDINTFSEQSTYGARLSANITNLSDGIRINFNPSSLVFNEKTWNIDKDGEVIISRTKLNANNFRLSNGDQVISILALPPEANSPQNIILTLTKVNLGELLPFILKEPKIQGITTGDLTIEDPFDKLKLYLNAQTDKTRFENDSIGITTINAFWDNSEKKASYFLESKNPNYLLGLSGKLNLSDTSKEEINTEINISNVKLSIIQQYLGDIFSNIEGDANGKLRIHGMLKEPDITGEIKVKNGKITVDYTKCTYLLKDPIIKFLPDKIDFGTITMNDLLGNQATFKGSLEHHFFRNFSYQMNATSKKILVLNTQKENNSLFFGKAIAKFDFNFSGPENDMRMRISGNPVDTSTINILTSTSSKQSADVDYIVWKTYGKEMQKELNSLSSKLTIDLDLTASPLLKMNVILDELTGDVISGIGNGNLKIHTGTSENLSILGRYNIENGNYNFNFQDIFKKPFKLEGAGNSYISWTGDPFDAEINIEAIYLAEKVRMSTLFTDPSSSTITGVSSDVLREISDVEVRCNLTGTLNKPNPTFQILIPQSSSVRNNATIDSKLKTINRDGLEVSKQATYLIVFKSFAPQAAIVASDLNSELINTTISGVINGILSNSVQNFFSKVLGANVDVNLNYSRTLMSGNLSNTGSGNLQNNFRENVSLQFIKSMLNDKLVISFGSDFNFSSIGSNAFSSNAQSFLFLPDVNVEYKITPDGKFRTSFFYRSNFDLLSSSGKRDRTGGNISFRTEFDRFFERKKKTITIIEESKTEEN